MSSAKPDGCVLVIFGASGDLTKRKLIPALYNLAESGHLPDRFAIIGVARPALDAAAFVADLREQVRSIEGDDIDPALWSRIGDRLRYVSGDFHDPALFAQLAATIEALGREFDIPANCLFYLAVPPDLFGGVATQLANAGLTREGTGWRRVVIEKPFGYDLESACALNETLAAGLAESQIYRIDHYLGKETVQNILAFRFANGIFEPIWNRRYVDHVQMTVAEQVGIEMRGAYYDKAGALRDIVQNHMFQLLTLVAMEPPISFDAEDVRDEKVRVLHAVLPFTPEDIRRRTVRAQYAASPDRQLSGYRDEPQVAPDSHTETFAALRLLIDNWRWAGVPFYLRTGKRLPARTTEIAVQFNRAPLSLFRSTAVDRLSPNTLVLRIQPNEGISLSFQAKVPGPSATLGTVTMNFSYAEYFKAEPSTGYETLLFDAMMGDQTLFHRMDMVKAGWRIVDPILRAWQADRLTPVSAYPAGSPGPADADFLIEQDGREWR